MLDKLVSAFTGGGGDFATNLIANRLTSKLIGNNTNKEALLGTLLMQGLGAENPLQNIFGAKADGKTEQMSAEDTALIHQHPNSVITNVNGEWTNMLGEVVNPEELAEEETDI